MMVIDVTERPGMVAGKSYGEIRVMTKKHCSVVIAVVCTLIGAFAASAGNFTGNPVTDGWRLDGNSLTNGIYIQGDGGFSFNAYSTSFIISSNLGPFTAGDELLGLGGVNNSGFILGPRIVAKFGSTGASFSASSIPSPNGNGNGAFPTDSGIGGVEIAFWYQYSGSDLASPSDNGGLRYPNSATNAQDLVLYNVDNIGTTTNLNRFAAVIALFTNTGGEDVLESWEEVVDITALADPRRGGFGSRIPVAGGLSDAVLQDTVDSSPADFTGALITPAVTNAPYLQLISISRQSNDITLGWKSAGGYSNIVQVTPGVAGNYSNNFADFSPVIFIPGTMLTTTNYVDHGGATNRPARYYRVRLVQ
jgi:hypothetical protein